MAFIDDARAQPQSRLMRSVFARAWILSLALGACSDDALYIIPTITDSFVQNAAPDLDVLWVVDNSGSMAAEQSGVGTNFASFISYLGESDVAFRIGVTSTDPGDGGQLHAPSETRIITPTTPDLEAVFIENVSVGTTGSPQEHGFESAALALGVGGDWAPGDAVMPPNEGFLRDTAALFIVVVSDEDDTSFGTIAYYRKLFETYKGAGNDGMVSFSAIIGPPEDGCNSPSRGSAKPGTRYAELTTATGGIWTSICEDFAVSLEALSLTAVTLEGAFVLSHLPNLSAPAPGCGSVRDDAFCVRVNGAIRPSLAGDEWSYDSVQNAIVFSPAHTPPIQAEITVEYLEFR